MSEANLLLQTLESRLTMFGEVFREVRQKLDAYFPAGVRFLAEEAFKNRYTLPEEQQIALRQHANFN